MTLRAKEKQRAKSTNRGGKEPKKQGERIKFPWEKKAPYGGNTEKEIAIFTPPKEIPQGKEKKRIEERANRRRKERTQGQIENGGFDGKSLTQKRRLLCKCTKG